MLEQSYGPEYYYQINQFTLLIRFCKQMYAKAVHYTCTVEMLCIWKGNDPSRFQSSSRAMYVLLRLVLPMLSQAEIMKMEKQYFSFMFFCKLGRWKPNYRGEMKLQKYLEKLMHYHILYIWKSKHFAVNSTIFLLKRV